jgi:ketosteroid isomerase-like protein
MKPMKPMKPMEPMKPMKAPERWWPEALGHQPSSTGGQNEQRYAFFADKQRLAVDAGDGSVKVYETGDHRISGVQQSQSGTGGKLTFTSQHGEVDLATLEPA